MFSQRRGAEEIVSSSVLSGHEIISAMLLRDYLRRSASPYPHGKDNPKSKSPPRVD